MGQLPQRDVNWWQELTAEWAAHQVDKSNPSNSDRRLYASDLDVVLGAPHEAIDSRDRPGGDRQYGMFVLAEFIENRFGTEALVESWERIGQQEPPSQVLVTILDSYGAGYEEEIVNFRADTYQLAPAIAAGGSLAGLIGFSDPDINQTTSDPDGSWRLELQRSVDTRVAGDANSTDPVVVNQARPLHLSQQVPAGSGQTSSTVTAALGAGGAVYADLEIPGGAARIELDFELPDAGLPAEDVTARLVFYDPYPAACAPT